MSKDTTKDKAKKADAFMERKAVPETNGDVARFYGVLPRYMVGGYWNPSRKHRRNF